MPSLSASLTWATAVDPVKLGAHFEAYVNLRPVFSTLRLCNRFGKGPEAAVARLPVEVITMIEGYLNEEEREKQLKLWTRDFKCWRDVCHQEDHLTKQQILDLYEEHRETCDHCHDVDCYDPESGDLNEEHIEFVREIITEGVSNTDWQGEHLDRKDGWEERMGSSADTHRGFFTKHEQLFLSVFGLKPWISHTQRTEGIAANTNHRTNLSATEAYLTMPDSGKVRGIFDRRLENPENDDIDSPYLATESGYGLSVAFPTKPSDASLERFPRALRMLGLLPLKKIKPMLYASGQDLPQGKTSAVDGEGSDIKMEADDADPAFPELQLLVSSGHPMDGLW